MLNMNFISRDLARYAGYSCVEAFQIDLRRYKWPLTPMKRLQGKYRYVLSEAVLAYLIGVLRDMNIPSSAIKIFLNHIDKNVLTAALHEFKAGLSDQIILTLPCSRCFEFDNGADQGTVHTSYASAHETLTKFNVIYINLSEISRAIRDGEL